MMNTIKSLLLAVVLLTGTLKANNGTTDVLSSASLKIQESLKMPLELTHEYGLQKITIYFSVNENGDVVNVNVKTNNLDVKKNLEKQFRQLNFKGLKPVVANSIVVNFKVC